MTHLKLSLLTATALLGACHYDPVSFEPTLTLTIEPAALTVAQGTRVYTEVTGVRTNSGATTFFTVDGTAEGIITAFETIHTHVGDVTTGTLTVIVAADVAPGNYDFVVRAQNGDADDVTKQVTVTVTEAEEGGNNQEHAVPQ